MFKVHHEPGVRRHSLGGYLEAPGKDLDLENTTMNFMQEKISSISLSPSSSPPSCILADIPLEILLKILDHLPLSWVISLALTCKGFYSVVTQFYQKKLALTDHDVAEFTLTLQKDIPNDWSSTRRRFSKSDVKSLLWHPSTSEAGLYFMDAYLVMNRHFYGNLHGDDYFEMEKTRKCLKTFCQGLYMARFHRIDGPMVPWKHFAALLNSIHLPICYHLEFVVEPYGGIHIQHTDKPIPLLTVYFDEMMDNESGSCPDFFADYEFSLKRDEDKKEWNLRFSTYHCLGSCRSPYSGAWSYLGRDFWSWSHPYDMQYGYLHCGRVRRQWHESNDRE
ncbi:hypothetical protein GGI43DRAFT_421539 [Trichoderma evansii]